MFEINYATEVDIPIWFNYDEHISKDELQLKIKNKRCYIIKDNDNIIGVMRYNLFWDSIPFLILIYFAEEYRNKGYGKNALLHWEAEMRSLDFSFVMTSTQVDENAQFFYRKLGYKDNGCLFFDFQAPEIFLIKDI